MSWSVRNVRELKWWDCGVAVGAREHASGDWGGYPYSEVAMRHYASVEEETTEPKVAYARFPESQPGEFRADWLP